MSLKELSQERLEEMAMIDIAAMILEEENKALDFREIFDRVAALKGVEESQKDAMMVQYYTDLNIDGRFMTKGSNLWGLKRWYPVEEIDEDITTAPKKKKKKKATKKVVAEDLELDDTLDEDDDILDEDLGDFDDEELEIEAVDDEEDFDFDDDEGDLEETEVDDEFEDEEFDDEELEEDEEN
ncbi:DNA-directed RNA polymerase subunit delta [Gracilibacillus ureilyticus]|uniref:Probable DNA-directed RNA polymerase subunit delta n=1 Tax=Gracilibacillus ureilyticus TaxID=531814 RepID=A0A1H9W389_9BACI|nr:DNA-directed RNA polymerase subunit delta [Gracilibacillus ureilyticus]SES28211.1 DNA-directed RNA polymerase subunit delta [Gracilibacillus ureilyticus]